jgi:hypothetical protein
MKKKSKKKSKQSKRIHDGVKKSTIFSFMTAISTLFGISSAEQLNSDLSKIESPIEIKVLKDVSFTSVTNTVFSTLTPGQQISSSQLMVDAIKDYISPEQMDNFLTLNIDQKINQLQIYVNEFIDKQNVTSLWYYVSKFIVDTIFTEEEIQKNIQQSLKTSKDIFDGAEKYTKNLIKQDFNNFFKNALEVKTTSSNAVKDLEQLLIELKHFVNNININTELQKKLKDELFKCQPEFAEAIFNIIKSLIYKTESSTLALSSTNIKPKTKISYTIEDEFSDNFFNYLQTYAGLHPMQTEDKILGTLNSFFYIYIEQIVDSLDVSVRGESLYKSCPNIKKILIDELAKPVSNYTRKTAQNVSKINYEFIGSIPNLNQHMKLYATLATVEFSTTIYLLIFGIIKYTFYSLVTGSLALFGKSMWKFLTIEKNKPISEKIEKIQNWNETKKKAKALVKKYSTDGKKKLKKKSIKNKK